MLRFRYCGLNPLGLFTNLQIRENEEDSWRRRASGFDAVKAESGSFYAFHGTSAENLHSILRCGKPATSHEVMFAELLLIPFLSQDAHTVYFLLTHPSVLKFSYQIKKWSSLMRNTCQHF